MIEMSVLGIALDPRSSQPIVVLNDSAHFRALPIWIGAPEARAISCALEHLKTERPLTHELMLNMITELGYKVEQVDIDTVKSDMYFATVKLVPALPDSKAKKSIDARPSDAIALALAASAPIFVSPQIVETGSVRVTTEEQRAQEAQFKKFIQDVKASDFNVPGLSIKPLEDDTDAPDLPK